MWSVIVYASGPLTLQIDSTSLIDWAKRIFISFKRCFPLYWQRFGPWVGPFVFISCKRFQLHRSTTHTPCGLSKRQSSQHTWDTRTTGKHISRKIRFAETHFLSHICSAYMLPMPHHIQLFATQSRMVMVMCNRLVQMFKFPFDANFRS